MFVIEDASHAEIIGSPHASYIAAIDALRRIAEIPFGQEPNRPPCKSWRDCDREYHLLEYDETQRQVISNKKALVISATEVTWILDEMR